MTCVHGGNTETAVGLLVGGNVLQVSLAHHHFKLLSVGVESHRNIVFVVQGVDDFFVIALVRQRNAVYAVYHHALR